MVVKYLTGLSGPAKFVAVTVRSGPVHLKLKKIFKTNYYEMNYYKIIFKDLSI